MGCNQKAGLPIISLHFPRFLLSTSSMGLSAAKALSFPCSWRRSWHYRNFTSHLLFDCKSIGKDIFCWWEQKEREISLRRKHPKKNNILKKFRSRSHWHRNFIFFGWCVRRKILLLKFEMAKWFVIKREAEICLQKNWFVIKRSI